MRVADSSYSTHAYMAHVLRFQVANDVEHRRTPSRFPAAGESAPGVHLTVCPGHADHDRCSRSVARPHWPNDTIDGKDQCELRNDCGRSYREGRICYVEESPSRTGKPGR